MGTLASYLGGFGIVVCIIIFGREWLTVLNTYLRPQDFHEEWKHEIYEKGNEKRRFGHEAPTNLFTYMFLISIASLFQAINHLLERISDGQLFADVIPSLLCAAFIPTLIVSQRKLVFIRILLKEKDKENKQLKTQLEYLNARQGSD